MPTTPPKSKRFLAISIGILIILMILWALFRTPASDTTSRESGFLKNIFGSKTTQQDTGGSTASNQDQTTIPHGHGDDTPEEQLAFSGNGAPADNQTGPCDILNTGIMDNDCDGIPNWLEERNGTNRENPNAPYKQGGWNHDGDTLFHGMDGHYACDAYDNKLLNCEKNITSEVEAITDIQDTDKGGVPDVMEIIKNKNPLEPCDDTNTCTGNENGGGAGLDENGNPIITTGDDTLAVSFNYDDNDPRHHVQLTLQSLLQELNTNTTLLDNFTKSNVLTAQGQGGLTETDVPMDLETVSEYQAGLLEQQAHLELLINEFKPFQALSANDINLTELNDFSTSVDFYAQNFLVFSNQLQLAIPPILQAYEGWVNRQSVHIDIDLEQSSFRDGKLRLYGFINTNGYKNLPVELRYTDITNAPYAQAYRNYCFARANLGFHQVDLGSGNNFLQDILGILNGAGKYQSTDLEFTYVNPNTGSVTYSNRATTAPGQRIPFTASIDNLKVDGLYSFALVDPTIIIPLHVPITVLGQDIQINTALPIPDPTNLLSSYIFSGPSCFDYLNRFIPVAMLDAGASSLVGGTEVDIATTPSTTGPEGGNAVESDSSGRFGQPRDTTDPSTLSDGLVRNGTATIVGTIGINTTNKLSPTIPAGPGGVVKVALYVRYGSPLLEKTTRDSTSPTLFNVAEGFRFTIPGVHQDEWFALYDAGTNAQILGPYQFKMLNDGVDTLSRFQERWYYIASYTPPQRSYYYMTEQDCLRAALQKLGRQSVCYATALKLVDIDFAQSLGVEDTAFDATVQKLKKDKKEGTKSFVGQTKAYLSGFIDTKGNTVNLAVDMISMPYVEEKDGNIVYPYGQDREYILSTIDPSAFAGGVNPTIFTKTFITQPGEKTTFEIPLSSWFEAKLFKPGHLLIFTIQDKNDASSIYYIGDVTTFLNSPDEITGGEIGTTTLVVDPGVVVGDVGVDIQFEDANGGLVPCGNSYVGPRGVPHEKIVGIGADGIANTGDELYIDPCDYNDLIELITRVIQYIILLIAPIATLLFAWAGILLITGHGNAAKIGQAKKIFLNVLVGIAIILLAWLLVAWFLHFMGVDPDYILLDMSNIF